MTFNLSTEEKAKLFDVFAAGEFDDLILLDMITGKARTLFSKDVIWQKTTGIRYEFESMIRKYILDVSADPDPDRTLEKLTLATIESALSENPIYHTDLIVRGDAGSIQLKKVSFYKLSDSEVICGISDISDAFQKASRYSDHLESALRKANDEINEKNTFLNMLSRNIRTPLYFIMGLTRIAQDEDPHETSAIEAYLHKISMSGTYMSSTIDDVLDLRRISKHEITLKPEPLLLQDLFRRIDSVIQPTVYEKGLLYSRDTDRIANLTVSADQHCMQQILVKMLQSAVSYTVKGGRIALTSRELFRSRGAVTLEFAVESRGIVIDQERLQSLFRPYDYVRDRIDSDLGSLDIDLIILKSYMLAMGANTLTAESDESKGTRISIALTMPLADEQKAPSGSAGIQLPDLNGRRVLLVDDNEINLEIGEKLLCSKGMDVVTATNGEEAINCFRKDKGCFDLILMDILMPVMDGLEATRRIREMYEYPNAKTIPIIAMTANAFRENFEESFRIGMNAHLVKPIEPDRLYAAISEALKNAPQE
ncbi:MAG: response regulator [Lachnospiraceae bacterium]|jgi:CheY-like chemotaxis protein|nr:response regulator [Lachnospiraceae bacterium]MCI1329153.1 response regulator [Lachnospiraceae bacterium]